ncbi:hypothetical protein K1719_025297 [Acacia pycnantha]|nr:hypothetical protein K1719_025297 [Acacia pycnantha]
MESLSTAKLPFSLVLLCIATTLLNLVFATEVCKFPAIFNFGDSNSDTGGFDASLFEIKSPYGETYFHRPAGRGSDGRLVILFEICMCRIEWNCCPKIKGDLDWGLRGGLLLLV